MKRLPLKLTLAILTFFIGVSAVGLWYFWHLETESQRLLSNPNSSVMVIKPTFENPCDYPQPKYRELEAEEAVYLAECFIIQNGYTDLPSTSDKSKIVPESVWGLTDEEGMRMRHDTLERKAYSYYQSERYGGSWVVMFRYKPHPEVVKFYGDKLNYTGRAVTMDFYGRRLRVQHSNYPLRMPKAKIINP